MADATSSLDSTIGAPLLAANFPLCTMSRLVFDDATTTTTTTTKDNDGCCPWAERQPLRWKQSQQNKQYQYLFNINNLSRRVCPRPHLIKKRRQIKHQAWSPPIPHHRYHTTGGCAHAAPVLTMIVVVPPLPSPQSQPFLPPPCPPPPPPSACAIESGDTSDDVSCLL